MFGANHFRDYLQSHYDEGAALAMSTYMKNRFQFFGIRSPKRKQLFAAYLKKFPPPNEPEVIFEFVGQCWQLEERETHYCALELLIKKHRLWGPDNLPFFEYLVTHNSWWDTVDSIASNILGPWLKHYPGHIPKTVDRWLRSHDLWLRRSSILFQLKYKADTDTALLQKVVLAQNNSKEFFIKKAIGWALREYSKTNPQFVKDFVEQYPLEPLSQREALKHLS